MQRRKFFGVLGCAAAAPAIWPFAARAQQPTMPVIGFLRETSSAAASHLVGALKNGMAEAGFRSGDNVAIEYRFADGQLGRLPGLAGEMIRHPVSLIVAGGNPAALAAKAATSTIPIVFVTGGDPVRIGLVASINRPGSNVTGVSFLAPTLGPKWLEILRELVPKGSAIGYLTNPDNRGTEVELRGMQSAAKSLGQQVLLLHARSEREIENAFAGLAERRVAALMVAGGALSFARRDQVVALAARYAIPAIYPLQEFVTAGGLMSYGASIADAYRQAGLYAGRIIKGTKPGDLPVILPTTFKFVINLKSAKALGLSLPPTLLARADEVID